MSTTPPAEPRLRVDAQRNYDAVLAAAHRLFAEHGIDVPMDEIGREAGVGKGTLYRHFPTKDHLYAAVSLERFARLRDRADELASQADPWDALASWVRDFDLSAHHYRGLSGRVSEGLGREDSEVSRACLPMRARADVLLRRAQDSGEMDPNIDIKALLTLVSSLPDSYRDGDGSSNLLDVVLNGLHRAPSPPPTHG
ncbi:TetR/AcrR family transcriptional regulator [Leifsonia sp. NPDC058230]|uniref:TetR/AcrR family transcriptional regulator n=1 Tax=Leifsonia sp. NPDC058230 TaxID=3346391 RepID=UPI0036DEB970